MVPPYLFVGLFSIALLASPLAELKKSNLALDRALRRSVPSWSPEGEMQRVEVRKIVGAYLDYGELARRSLAGHWNGLTAKQRTSFVTTLRELVERSYLQQLRGRTDYTIRYDREERAGEEATVEARLDTKSRGKPIEIALQYKLISKDGRWVVYDVVTDDDSMLESYRNEFDKIISRDGFDALMTRMKKKLAESIE